MNAQGEWTRKWAADDLKAGSSVRGRVDSRRGVGNKQRAARGEGSVGQYSSGENRGPTYMYFIPRNKMIVYLRIHL